MIKQNKSIINQYNERSTNPKKIINININEKNCDRIFFSITNRKTKQNKNFEYSS